MKQLIYMNCRICHTALIAAFTLFSLPSDANVYIVIYATLGGRTGHAGFAVDNYRIQTTAGIIDTVADGTLTYYDLWPALDEFGLFGLAKDREPKYYKLPNAIWPKAITLTYLYDFGLPHQEHYPPDALLMLRTTYHTDQTAMDFLDSLIGSGRAFNPRHYNCSDFVIRAIKKATGKNIRAKEFMPFGFTTTPNKLCRRLMRLPGIIVIKSPGNKTDGAFLWQRVFKRKPPPMFLVYN